MVFSVKLNMVCDVDVTVLTYGGFAEVPKYTRYDVAGHSFPEDIQERVGLSETPVERFAGFGEDPQDGAVPVLKCHTGQFFASPAAFVGTMHQ